MSRRRSSRDIAREVRDDLAANAPPGDIELEAALEAQGYPTEIILELVVWAQREDEINGSDELFWTRKELLKDEGHRPGVAAALANISVVIGDPFVEKAPVHPTSAWLAEVQRLRAILNEHR